MSRCIAHGRVVEWERVGWEDEAGKPYEPARMSFGPIKVYPIWELRHARDKTVCRAAKAIRPDR